MPEFYQGWGSGGVMPGFHQGSMGEWWCYARVPSGMGEWWGFHQGWGSGGGSIRDGGVVGVPSGMGKWWCYARVPPGIHGGVVVLCQGSTRDPWGSGGVMPGFHQGWGSGGVMPGFHQGWWSGGVMPGFHQGSMGEWWCYARVPPGIHGGVVVLCQGSIRDGGVVVLCQSSIRDGGVVVLCQGSIRDGGVVGVPSGMGKWWCFHQGPKTGVPHP